MNREIDRISFYKSGLCKSTGTESKNPADVTIDSSAPTGAEAALAAGSEAIATIVKAPRNLLRPVHSR